MNADSLPIARVAFVDGADDDADSAKARFKGEFPGRAARRMTHLGIMVGLCIEQMDTAPDAPIVYATAFAESRALESYIDSFPTPSPALFQTSIHPSAVEQALIPRARAVNAFYPIIADRNLGGHALETAWLLDATRRLAIVGEERGSWLCNYGLASDRAFACALQLDARAVEPIGFLTLDRSQAPRPGDALETWDLATATRDRRSIRAPSLALGGWLRIDWI